jgi:hypothetical protein
MSGNLTLMSGKLLVMSGNITIMSGNIIIRKTLGNGIICLIYKMYLKRKFIIQLSVTGLHRRTTGAGGPAGASPGRVRGRTG